MKLGFFCKKRKKWGGCKKVDLSSTQGALCTVSVFFYILLIWGRGVHTHPTYGPATFGSCLEHSALIQLWLRRCKVSNRIGLKLSLASDC